MKTHLAKSSIVATFVVSALITPMFVLACTRSSAPPIPSAFNDIAALLARFHR